MKKTYSNPAPDNEDDLATEYVFDYSKAKLNRFATRVANANMTVIVLDADIAQAFPTSEAVNQALRQLIQK
jgi:glyceraldehyde-3-phosphate dehydrogenase/erythrose-4-phosphate dehydrogenase